MDKIKKVCPSQFQETLEDFVTFLQAKELRESTIFLQSNIITSTLLKLDSYLCGNSFDSTGRENHHSAEL